jgi:hypothetical protein
MGTGPGVVVVGCTNLVGRELGPDVFFGLVDRAVGRAAVIEAAHVVILAEPGAVGD